MQCYKPIDQSCNPGSYQQMANPGHTQYYSQPQSYYTDNGMGETQTTIDCYTHTQTTPMPNQYYNMDHNKPTGYGSGLGYGMGQTHGYTHSPSHYMDQNKVHGHGHRHGLRTHTIPSNGYGHGLGLSQSTHCVSSQTGYSSDGMMARHGKAKKKGDYHKKRLEGHCSDSCGSDSDNDEGCGRRMHC